MRLSISGELAPLREEIRLFEQKYHKTYPEFVIWMKNQDENPDVWSDYLEWSANERLVQELIKKLTDVENAQHIEVA